MIRTMLILDIFLTTLGLVHATQLNNNAPTIWQQSTIPTMKKQINALYRRNLNLYNKRSVLDGVNNSCIIPSFEPHYAFGTSCPIGNMFAAKAVRHVADAWRGLASHMFPVYYNLTDDDYGPRASFSDFSHFYNHMLLEIRSLQNTTVYYICRADIRNGSDTWNATGTAHYDNDDKINVRFGPPVAYVDIIAIPADNGTELAYPFTSSFEKSIEKNSILEQDGWEDLRILMGQPDAEYSRNICAGVFANQHPSPPRPPGTFP